MYEESPSITWLKQFAMLAKKNGIRPINKYQSVAEFLLKEGRSWKTSPEIKIERGEPQQCFRNAALLALQNKRFTYVEGYATAVIPVHHAWVVDENGTVIETTWQELGEDYFGIAIDHEYLRKRLLKYKVYGMIEQPEYRFPILSEDRSVWAAQRFETSTQAGFAVSLNKKGKTICQRAAKRRS